MKNLLWYMIILMLFSSTYYAQVINGQFITSISQPTYSVTIAVDMQSGTGTAGIATLEFTYNTADLSFPSSPQKNLDYILYGDFNTYPAQNILTPSANSVRIALSTFGPPPPVALSTTPTNIITLYFTILDELGSSNLNWVTTEISPGFPQPNYTVGIWPNVNDSPLPVELTSFTAEANGNKVDISWKTATETNNYGFDVERKVTNGDWSKIGFVEGAGNSSSPKEYNFLDSDINSAGIYFYRLKQIDNDGTYEFSKTVKVDFTAPISLELNQNYPNPFNPSTTISFKLPESGKVILKVYNIMGEEIKTLVDGFMDAGSHKVEFSAIGGSASGGNAYTLPSGMYLYILSTNGFTETKKMLLMK